MGRIISAGRVPAGGHLAKLLNLSTRDDVWEIVITQTLDDAQASLRQTYLRIRGTLTVGAPPQFEAGGPKFALQLATKYGVEITESGIEIKAVPASMFESEALGIGENPLVIQVGSLDFANGHRVVGFTRTVVVSDISTSQLRCIAGSVRQGPSPQNPSPDPDGRPLSTSALRAGKRLTLL